MTIPNPLDPIRVICERLGDIAAELGLELHQVAVIPGPPDGSGSHAPDVMQVMFIITEQAVDPAGFEQKRMDEQFSALTQQFAVDEQKQKLTEKSKTAEADIKGWLEGK